jgi:8-amino-7-oxononanoate synthase
MQLGSFQHHLAKELDQLRDSETLRTLRRIEKGPGKRVRLNGRELLNCSSNDYLGLSTDLSLLQEFYREFTPETALPLFSLGAASSRLLTGNHGAYDALEKMLAEKYQRPAALVMNSGYHANLGILSALAGPRDVIFSDRLNHASMLDGARLSEAKLIRYNHLDNDHLENQLKKFRGQFEKALIVTESIFSMDGDAADIKRLASLRDSYDCFLMVDEAHAVGVFGDSGLGWCEAQAAQAEVDLLLGTFGKAWASQGAFCVCDPVVRDYLVNKMRPFIFTTALPPVVVYWNLFILRQLDRWRDARIALLENAERLRQALRMAGLQTRGVSQIVPVLIGENGPTIRASQALIEQGLLLLPIRPPTVPANTSRLRISLTANLDWNDIARIPEIVQMAVTNQ